MSQQSRNIESLVVVDPAGDVAHGDDSRTRFTFEKPCQVAADVAEALDHDASALERDPEVARVLLHHVHDAASGCLLAAE